MFASEFKVMQRVEYQRAARSVAKINLYIIKGQ